MLPSFLPFLRATWSRAHRVDRAVGEAVPQRLLVVLGAQRRVDLAQRPDLHAGVVGEEVRARLDVERGPAVALPCRSQLVEGKPPADVDDVKRATGDVGVEGRGDGALRLDEVGPRLVPRLQVVAALRQQPLPQLPDDLDILGVDVGDASRQLRHLVEVAVHEAVVGARDAQIGALVAPEAGEVLVRLDAEPFGVLFHLVEVNIRGWHEVEAVVHDGVPRGAVEVRLDDRPVGRSGHQIGERGGHAADGRRPRLRLPVVQTLGKPDVDVGVDDAGEDVQPRGVVDVGGLGPRGVVDQRGDLTAAHRHVGPHDAFARRHHAPALDDHVEPHGLPILAPAALRVGPEEVTPRPPDRREPRPWKPRRRTCCRCRTGWPRAGPGGGRRRTPAAR